jgi:hypothetical protein
MHGRMGRLFGKYTEELFFEGDQSAANPMRYLPTPVHTKYAQERTALSQYIQQEAVGTRMRRWQRPFHDFLAPYLRASTHPLHPPLRTQRGRRLPRRLLINNTLSFFQHKS